MPREISILMSDLSSNDAAVRIAAADELSRLAEDARPAAVPLVRACGDEEEEVRELAAGALEELGPPDAGDLEALVEQISSRTPDAAYWAITLIGRMSSSGAAAVPPLLAVLGSESPAHVRQRAVWALGEMGRAATAAVPELRKLSADDGDPRMARLAEHALERISG